MGLPTLGVVSGPPGTGKTTLAHRLAAEIGCPAICRDEIKEGMVHASPGYRPSLSDPLSLRTLDVFFATLHLLLSAEVTVVAEAAFADRLWRPGLAGLTGLATIRVLHCTVDPTVARQRLSERRAAVATRAAHADGAQLADPALSGAYQYPSLQVPTLVVDTTDGYRPGLATIAAFISQAELSEPQGAPAP